MEVYKIVEGQRYSKRLNERLITILLKMTYQRPHERGLVSEAREALFNFHAWLDCNCACIV